MTGFVIAEKVFDDILENFVDEKHEEKHEEETSTSKKDMKVYVHGKVCEFIHNTYVEKNDDYGDSFAKTREKYPNAICIRLNDKLSRLEQLLTPGHVQKVKDEAIEDTLIDLACYAIMELVERVIEEKRYGESE